MKNQIGLLSLLAGTVACSLSTLGAVPVVSNVKMTQDQLTRLVTITYDVAETMGIVTLDIQTNGVSIGAENIKFVDGDVNQEVEIGSHTITWRPDKSWQGHKVENATAKVSIWDKSAPPAYMAVELTAPYHKKWYTCEAALPQGIDSDLYRGEVLLMRRIHRPDGSKWMMGSPSGESGRNGARETLHRVTLTNDYWIGVFEITQRQWEIIMGNRPAENRGSFRPVERVSHDRIRGKEAGFHYPKDPDPNSFLGKLRARTELPFDLPSEMQWEYACRAGTDSAYNNGADSGIEELGCFSGNKGSGQHVRVGSYLPNAWGLYDMHGNVWELCLDWLKDDISGLDGRVNTVPSDSRVIRGGSWYYDSASCRSANRSYRYPINAVNSNIGFRLVCSERL